MDQDHELTANERLSLELELSENLRRCQKLLKRIGPSRVAMDPDSAAAKHLLATGHVMRFGCCAEARARGDAVDAA